MEKRHYDFVIGVLELWNEPIDQKSTDQVRPRVVSEFHLEGKISPRGNERSDVFCSRRRSEKGSLEGCCCMRLPL